MSAIHLFDGNNVMLRDLDSATHQRLGLRQRWEAANQHDQLHIWVWDGQNHNHRRRTVYPPYKGQRLPMGEDRFAQIGLFREVLTHSNAWQVTCPSWEGDDVIASLAQRFSGPVTIHSNDLDYAQLLVHPHITLNGVRDTPCPPERLALYKAMVGDPSDNIKGIPSFGVKAWNLLEPHWLHIEVAVDGCDEDTIRAIPFQPKHKSWLLDPPNLMSVKAMLTITRFFDVPEDVLNKGITKGIRDFEAMDTKLRRFFL